MAHIGQATTKRSKDAKPQPAYRVRWTETERDQMGRGIPCNPPGQKVRSGSARARSRTPRGKQRRSAATNSTPLATSTRRNPRPRYARQVTSLAVPSVRFELTLDGF